MTPAEFAEAHGLSIEEATYILSRRATLASVAAGNSRVEQARSILALAQKRVGVHPVTEELEKVYDPDADVGRVEFYEKKGPQESTWAQFGRGGEKPNPGDWEEPP